MAFPTLEELTAELASMEKSPSDNGMVELIVCRPNHGERRVLEEGEFNTVDGLVGDNWLARGSRHTEDGRAHPDMQVAMMNSRVIQLIAQDPTRWQLAGDELFVDFDLSVENCPVGQRLAIGTVILEVTPMPHNGCAKFTERFGSGATHFVNSPEGRANRRRGINTRVVQNGIIRRGDRITKLSPLA